jgi:hypothetical protein
MASKPPLSRSLGQFFGILWKAAKEEVPAPAGPVVVREEVREKVVETAQGRITLRRRVIDEVVGGEKPG